MATPLFLECLECGHRQAFRPLTPTLCEACPSAWVEAHYDYAALKQALARGLPDRPFDLWRYHEILPLASPPNPALCAGGTPLRRSHRYAQSVGLARLYIKDERHAPTQTFKDRQAAVSVAALCDAGVRETVIASTGNAAVAYAAACAQTGITLWTFMPDCAAPAKLHAAALFGARVVKVHATYDQTKQLAAEFARRRGLTIERGTTSLTSRESMKTIAYEIVEQLGWRAPDWYIQAVSGGLGPLGVYHGFQELHAMGVIDRVPALGVVQAEGCAPMVRAFKAGRSVAEPVISRTSIAILGTGDPGKTYTYVWTLLQHFGGTMECVSDAEARAALQTLARADGMAVEPATAVAFAGLQKMIQQDQIKPDATVVVNCSGNSLPTERPAPDDATQVELRLDGDQAGAPQAHWQTALDRLDQIVPRGIAAARGNTAG